eukprot:TRINITY_DN55149_c0_g1_i1.p1 TRINITY_DN55149_c0_g1~~TRINITY_DN55149_c0_g1_i1.p1  ORF type:complete len:226 (+),score=20.11 TRINITY_DN55149_c0_g1_i1:75-752(+)
MLAPVSTAEPTGSRSASGAAGQWLLRRNRGNEKWMSHGDVQTPQLIRLDEVTDAMIQPGIVSASMLPDSFEDWRPESPVHAVLLPYQPLASPPLSPRSPSDDDRVCYFGPADSVDLKDMEASYPRMEEASSDSQSEDDSAVAHILAQLSSVHHLTSSSGTHYTSADLSCGYTTTTTSSQDRTSEGLVPVGPQQPRSGANRPRQGAALPHSSATKYAPTVMHLHEL